MSYDQPTEAWAEPPYHRPDHSTDAWPAAPPPPPPPTGETQVASYPLPWASTATQWQEPAWSPEAAPPVYAPGTETYPPAWTPEMVAPTARRSRWRWLIAAAIVALIGTSGGLGWLAWHNDQASVRWRNLEQVRAAQLAAVQTQLRTANSRIGALNGQLSAVNGQVTALQGQLSTVADQKEKVVDQETALQQLLSSASTVADDLQQCITATNQFDSDFTQALTNFEFKKLNALQSEAQQVDNTCNAAESANQQLQSAIQSAP